MSGDGKDGAFWTPERIATLREFAGKISGGEIANIIGATRNMIIGKMRRLGLVGRAPAVTDTSKRTHRRKTPFRKPEAADEVPEKRAPHPWRPEPKEINPPREAAEASLPASGMGLGIDIMELTNDTCRWPLWADRGPVERHIYCGDPVDRSKVECPYCAIHRKMADGRRAS